MSLTRMLHGLLVVFALNTVGPACGQQVAVVGGGYGRHVRNSIVKKVLLPMDVIYEDLGDTMDFATLDSYSLVIVAHGDEKLIAGQEDVGAAFERYVRDGGHVLLIGDAPRILFGSDLTGQPWIGAQSWVYLRDAPPAGIVVPSHPWLNHLDPDAEYFWLSWTQRLRGPTTAQVLIGSDNAIFMSRNDYGKGWAVFLSRGPFPYRRDDVGPMREAQIEMLRKLVAEAVAGEDGHIYTMTDLAAEMAAQLDGDPVLWRRDWEFGSKEGPQFRPPGPRVGEVGRKVRVDLARGERESVAVNLTSSEIKGPVRVEIAGLPEGAPDVEVRVMDRAPLIPWDRADVKPHESPFWLMPPEDLEPVGDPQFMLEPGRTRVLWLQVHAPLDCEPREYEGKLRVLRADQVLTSITVIVKVWPVTMPIDRPFQLKTWGCVSPDRRFWHEFARQSVANGRLSYPDLSRVMLPDQGISLEQALKLRPGPFTDPDNFPRLDFSYLDDYVGGQAAAGQSIMTLQDVRTGTQVANAGTGLSLEWHQAAEAPETWRRLWVAYYRELMCYLQSKGFRRVETVWTDEPTVESIKQRYVPIAHMYIEAGMAPGSTWTTPGFMSPEDVNYFAQAVSDWSMYTIMMPKFNSYLREGLVTLREDAVIGCTRGGYGFAHRNPYHLTRRLGWDSWHHGANFLRTGPVFKGWLYYVNYERFIRDEGVAGERLIAYGSSDPNDLSVPLVPSPDWEAARDACDDISLVRILEARIVQARKRPEPPTRLLNRIEAELASFVGDRSPYDLHLEPRHYEHADLVYDYDAVVDATTPDLERAKRRVLELISKLQPYVSDLPARVVWHEVTLSDTPGVGRGAVHATGEATEQANSLRHRLRQRTGVQYDPVLPLNSDVTEGIYLALVDDAETEALLASREWFPQVDMPGLGSYVLLTSAETNAVAIIGGDEAGLQMGIDAFMTFVSERL